jgi:hypothetical protein
MAADSSKGGDGALPRSPFNPAIHWRCHARQVAQAFTPVHGGARRQPQKAALHGDPSESWA